MFIRPIVVGVSSLLAVCGGVMAQDVSSNAADTPATEAAGQAVERHGDVSGVQPVGDDPALEARAAAPAIKVSVGSWFEHAFKTDIDDDAGKDADVAVSRLGGGLALSGSFNERWRWILPVSYEYSSYDFNDAGGLINGPSDEEPIDDGNILAIAPTLVHVLNERWSISGSFAVQAGFESGASFGDSLTYGGAVSVRYVFSKDFSFALGVAGKSRLEDSAIVVPIIGAEWQINDKLRLGSGLGGHAASGSRGPGVALFYSPVESLTLAVGGSFEFREYRLEEDDTDASEGILADERVNLLFGLDWKATENISLGVYGGVAVWQEYEFKNEGGNTLHEVNADPTGVLGVNFSIRF